MPRPLLSRCLLTPLFHLLLAFSAAAGGDDTAPSPASSYEPETFSRLALLGVALSAGAVAPDLMAAATLQVRIVTLCGCVFCEVLLRC